MMLKGDNIDAILDVLDKIAAYEMVSGLQLNLSKCEFLAVNCDDAMIGVWVDENGEATEDENIMPVLETIQKIEKRFNTAGSSPIGRVLYAKFLMGQMFDVEISDDMADELCKAMRKMTWTRARMTDQQV